MQVTVETGAYNGLELICGGHLFDWVCVEFGMMIGYLLNTSV
jgi:hypothetical protein